MISVFFKVLAFILMIALGYLMKARHILQQEDSQILMKIIINMSFHLVVMIIKEHVQIIQKHTVV